MHSSLANRQIVKSSLGRLGVGLCGLADVADRRHCRPTWKEYSDAAPDIAVTDARLLSKLHHAAVSRSVGGAAEKASSFSLSCSSPERVVWLACFGGVKNRFHLRECRGRTDRGRKHCETRLPAFASFEAKWSSLQLECIVT